MPDAPDQRLLEALLDSWDRNNTILVNLLRALPDGGLTAKLAASLDALNASYLTGTSWTTDATFRETREEITALQAEIKQSKDQVNSPSGFLDSSNEAIAAAVYGPIPGKDNISL